MRLARITLPSALALALLATPALAGDLEGTIESVDAGNGSLVVQSITFHVTDQTEYDDVDGLANLQQGQTVEVEFAYRDGRHFAEEIDLE